MDKSKILVLDRKNLLKIVFSLVLVSLLKLKEQEICKKVMYASCGSFKALTRKWFPEHGKECMGTHTERETTMYTFIMWEIVMYLIANRKYILWTKAADRLPR